MYFTSGNKALFQYERLMQQAPGDRPRRSGCVLVKNKEVLEKTFLFEDNEAKLERMKAYQMPKRVQKIILKFKDGMIFRDERHKNLFEAVLYSNKRKVKCENRRYMASVFLLTSDPILWEAKFPELMDCYKNGGSIRENYMVITMMVFQCLFHYQRVRSLKALRT